MVRACDMIWVSTGPFQQWLPPRPPQSDVVDGNLMTTYQIKPFIMHLWEDDKRGITKHTILKDINTPLQLVPVTITDRECQL